MDGKGMANTCLSRLVGEEYTCRESYVQHLDLTLTLRPKTLMFFLFFV